MGTLAFVYPLEFARSRMSNDISNTGPVKIIGEIYRAEGVRGIYRGSVNFFIGAMIFRAFYFGLYDTLKEHTPEQLIYRFPACFLSSVIAIFAVYPLDTIRKRIVMTSGHCFKYGGFYDCMKQMYAKEGWGSFYKGWQLGLLQGVTAAVSLLYLDKMGTRIRDRAR